MSACLTFVSRRAVGIFVVAIFLTAFSIEAASSQGIIDTFRDGTIVPPAREAVPRVTAYIEPLSLSPPLIINHSLGSKLAPDVIGAGTAYCVRLCDGRYFPLARNAAVSAAEQCRSFCPAARTKIFFGASIKDATATDGTRHASLDTALFYRTRLVNNCTCNGRDAFGGARMSSAADPTLRAGDIVAGKNGFAVYTGQKLVPVGQTAIVPADIRRKLAVTKITPTPQHIEVAARPSIEIILRKEDRRAQLSR